MSLRLQRYSTRSKKKESKTLKVKERRYAHQVEKDNYHCAGHCTGYLSHHAVTSWNKPDESKQLCTKVNINISDSNNAGFLTATEIKQILEKAHLYPLNKKITDINPRNIEEALKVGPFINTAQCYKTKDGHVNIYITQRMPIIRIKSSNGADYYLDDNGGNTPEL